MWLGYMCGGLVGAGATLSGTARHNPEGDSLGGRGSPDALVSSLGVSSKHRLMLDSGSQSTACGPGFAPEYGCDDTERAKLWDISDNQIKSYGKKVVDVNFRDDSGNPAIDGSFMFVKVVGVYELLSDKKATMAL